MDQVSGETSSTSLSLWKPADNPRAMLLRYVTQDLSVSPVYDAIFWNPPDHERYKFRHPRPPKPTNLKIYEAHGACLHQDLLLAFID